MRQLESSSNDDGDAKKKWGTFVFCNYLDLFRTLMALTTCSDDKCVDYVQLHGNTTNWPPSVAFPTYPELGVFHVVVMQREVGFEIFKDL